jgi:hypothetical protein
VGEGSETFTSSLCLLPDIPLRSHLPCTTHSRALKCFGLSTTHSTATPRARPHGKSPRSSQVVSVGVCPDPHMPFNTIPSVPSPDISTALDILLLSTVHSEALRIPQPSQDTFAVLPTIRTDVPHTINNTPDQSMSTSAHPPIPPLIACLESYVSPALPIGTSLSNDPTAPALHIVPTATLTKLKNLGSARTKDMRTLGQSKQIVSHIPISAPPATCVKFNDA